MRNWRGMQALGFGSILMVIAGLALACQPAAAQTPINIGSSVNGALTGNDQTLDSGRYVDTFELYGRAGQQIQVTVTTTAFDAATAIGNGESFFEIDDGGRAGTNASLIVTLPSSGRYFVTVSSIELWRTGAYVFAVTDVSAARANPVRPSAPPALQGATAGVQPSLSLGATINGTLGAGDDTLEGGSYVDAYRFQGRAGQVIRVTAQANGTDVVLAIGDPDGSLFEMHDPAQTGDPYADLTVTLPRTANYMIVVNARQSGRTSPYTLWVSDGR